MLESQALGTEAGWVDSHQAALHQHACVAHSTTCDVCNSNGAAKPNTAEGD